MSSHRNAHQFQPHHLAQKVASDPSSSKETWGVMIKRVCLMIKHHPEKKCCLENPSFFLDSSFEGKYLEFCQKETSHFSKNSTKNTTKSRLPQRSVRSLKVSSYTVLKDVDSLWVPKNPSKTSKNLTWHFELSLRIFGYLYISTHHSFGINIEDANGYYKIVT